MATTRDKSGRPVVVVTGMGMITSLGVGKTENWKNLTAGKSGIRTITRFPTDGLKTTVAGAIDFVETPPSSPAKSERFAEMVIEEAISEAKIGSKGSFPGPLFLAVAPIEVEWLQREELAKASGANDAVNYDDLIRAAASGRFREFHERFVF